MRHLLLSCLLLGLMTHLKAQTDFELFQFNTPYVYEQPSASAVFTTPYLGVFLGDADPSVPPSRVLRQTDPNDPWCLRSLAPFYGDSIATYNGLTELYNSGVAGVMTVRHADPVGSTWLAFADPDSEYELWMSVDELAEESFLGMTDQVKTIGLSQRLSATDSLTVIDPVLKISQNHGLIQAADLWRLRDNQETISLVGLADSGYLDYDEQDFFGLSVGSELHIREIDQVLQAGSTDHYAVTEQVYRVSSMLCDPVLGQTDVLWSRKSITYKQAVLNDISTNYDSTTIVNFNGSWSFDWSGELNWLQGKAWQFWAEFPTFGHPIQIRQSPYGTPAKSLGGTFSSTNGEPDGCYEYVTESHSGPGETYYVGFAGPYFEGYDLGGYLARQLVYGDTNYGTVGTPFNCAAWETSSVVEVWSERVLNVYPNPARNFTTVSFSEAVGPVDIILLDGSGRKVRQYASAAQSQRLDFGGELAAGVYQLLVRKNGQLLGRKRLVID